MSRDEITIPKKLVHWIVIGLTVLTAILFLEWKFSVFNFSGSQNIANSSQEGIIGLKVGQDAPDLTLNDLDGNPKIFE